ncbi:unnamed protein product [Orchesella dallaii]|uniref:Serine/threonine-protein phosphatase PGAM5, mitochondrial n=1 Tax=Orchesella dallaii TaxID=48710 RepID=A0ABP1RHN1_9HEXA
MNYQRTKFLKYCKWIGGIAASATVSVVVANYSTTSASTSYSSSWTPTKPSNVPDTFGKWDYNWDKREPYSLLTKSKSTKSECDNDLSISEQLEKHRSKASRHIFLIRHGHFHTAGEIDREQDLTKTGKTQAQLTGKRLKDSGIIFTSFRSSLMRRAMQTAEIMWKELEQDNIAIEAHDPLLLEGYPCSPEPPVGGGGPSISRYYEDGPRIEATFRKYFHRADPDQEEDSFEIIVSHSNVIRYCVCRALQVPGEAWHRLSLNNCSITFLSILPNGRVILRALGDSGHMPVDLHTTKYAICD